MTPATEYSVLSYNLTGFGDLQKVNEDVGPSGVESRLKVCGDLVWEIGAGDCCSASAVGRKHP